MGALVGLQSIEELTSIEISVNRQLNESWQLVVLGNKGVLRGPNHFDVRLH